MSLSLYDPHGWGPILRAIREERWDAAENLLTKRDAQFDANFDAFTYAPTLTQSGGQSATISTATKLAQVIRIERLIIFQWDPTISSTSGTASDPPIYVSLPLQIADAIATSDFVGVSKFETSVLGYHSGGVSLDAANSRLITWPNEVAYASPPNYGGKLEDLESMGFFCAWRLPSSKLSR